MKPITYSTSLQIKITGYGSGMEGHRTDPFKLVSAFFLELNLVIQPSDKNQHNKLPDSTLAQHFSK